MISRSTPSWPSPCTPGPGIRTDAAVAVCTLDGDSCTRLFAAGGSRFTRDSAEQIRIPETLSGTVVEVDYSKGTVIVETDANGSDHTGQQERPARFFNSRHSSVHRVACQRTGDKRLMLEVRDDEVLTGRLRVSSFDAGQRRFETSSYSPHVANLIGMHALDGDMKHIAGIVSAGKGAVELESGRDASSLAEKMKRVEGKDLWVADFGPGDKVEIEGMLYYDILDAGGAERRN